MGQADDLWRVNVGGAALLEWVRGVANWRLNGPPPVDYSATGLQALPARQAELLGIAAASPQIKLRPPKHRSESVAMKRLGMNRFALSPLRRSGYQMMTAF